MRTPLLVLVLSAAACGDRDRPIPVLVVESPQPARIELHDEIRVLAEGMEDTMAAQKQHDAEIQVAMRWLESVRYGVPADDPVLALPLVSIVPPCESNAPCARQRIEALMSIEPKLLPNIVASDLISHFYHSRAFDTLGAATHVNVSVFGDLARLGIDRADITFAVMPDASGKLAIRGIEIAAPRLDD